MTSRSPQDAMNAFDIRSVPLDRLQALRAKFFHPHPQGLDDYWDSHETLAAYDATLARRIAWKWDAVVEAVWDAVSTRASGAFEPFHTLVDWGCGSGAAVTTALERGFSDPSAGPVRAETLKVVLHDRSARAMAFARARVEALGVKTVETTSDPLAHVDGNTLLLVSHVLTELDSEARSRLTHLASRAGGVIWVEPGTPFCGDALVGVRETLRSQGHLPLLPCPHVGRCGLAGRARPTEVSGARQGDWCHVFAEPPREVFQDGNWARLAKALGIDLRSLPVSFLFLLAGERKASFGRPDAHPGTPPQRSEGLVLGRPKTLKGHTELVVCSREEVATVDWQHKADRAYARALERPEFLRRFPLPKAPT